MKPTYIGLIALIIKSENLASMIALYKNRCPSGFNTDKFFSFN